MDMALYTQVSIYTKSGGLLAEAESIEVHADSKAVVVDTIEEGFAGVILGPRKLRFVVRNAVPDAAFEMDPNKQYKKLEKKGEFEELTIFAGSTTLMSAVFITNWSLAYQVNGKASLSFEAVGRWSDWE